METASSLNCIVAIADYSAEPKIFASYVRAYYNTRLLSGFIMCATIPSILSGVQILYKSGPDLAGGRPGEQLFMGVTIGGRLQSFRIKMFKKTRIVSEDVSGVSVNVVQGCAGDLGDGNPPAESSNGEAEAFLHI